MKKGFDIAKFLSKNKMTMGSSKKSTENVYKGYNDVRRSLINEAEVVNGKLKIGNKLVELSQIDMDNTDKPYDSNRIETIQPQKMPMEMKKHFLEIISTYRSYQEQMERPSDISEVAKTLGAIVEAAKELALNEAGDWFDKVTIKRNMQELEKLDQKFEKFANDARDMDNRLHALYEDMGHILNRYYEISDIDPMVMKKRLGMQSQVNEAPTKMKKIAATVWLRDNTTNETWDIAYCVGLGDAYLIQKALQKIAPKRLEYMVRTGK